MAPASASRPSPRSTWTATPQDTAKGLYEVFRREYKATKATGWALIDVDHPLYVTYAGLDVIYVTRLLRELSVLIRGNGLSQLATWEHRVSSSPRASSAAASAWTPSTPGAWSDLAAEAERLPRRRRPLRRGQRQQRQPGPRGPPRHG